MLVIFWLILVFCVMTTVSRSLNLKGQFSSIVFANKSPFDILELNANLPPIESDRVLNGKHLYDKKSWVGDTKAKTTGGNENSTADKEMEGNEKSFSSSTERGKR